MILVYLVRFLLGVLLPARLRRLLRPPPAPDPQVVTDDFMSMKKARVLERRVVRSLEDLQAAVRHARQHRLPISMIGTAHASDGQQFCDGALVLDVRGLDKVLALDEATGLITVEAGVRWQDLVEALRRRGSAWGIHLKQTLLNKATVGGSVSVNIHGRKMGSPPLIRYVRSLKLVDAAGELRTCSRTENPELFSLAIGGYGAFGIVYSVEMELQRVRNLVRDPIPRVPIDDVASLYLEKLKQGYLYGDAHSNGTGIVDNWCFMTMYQATDDLPAVLPFQNTRTARFLYSFGAYLLHVDHHLPLKIWKQEIEKVGPYSTTDSCQFTSLSEYYEGIHDKVLGFPGNDMHVELQVEPGAFRDLIRDIRELIRPYAQLCIFCDLRFVQQDTESFLAYARKDYFTCSPTFHMDPSNEHLLRPMYEKLYDLAVERYGGGFYLWDYFLGRPRHLLKAYPQLPDFLRKKREYDPDGVFSSLWLQTLERIVSEETAQAPATERASA